MFFFNGLSVFLMLDNIEDMGRFIIEIGEGSFRAQNNFYALNGYERVLASLVSSGLRPVVEWVTASLLSLECLMWVKQRPRRDTDQSPLSGEFPTLPMAIRWSVECQKRTNALTENQLKCG